MGKANFFPTNLFLISNDCCDKSGDDDVCVGVCSVVNATGNGDEDVGMGNDSGLDSNGAEDGGGSGNDDVCSGNSKDGGVNDECWGETVWGNSEGNMGKVCGAYSNSDNGRGNSECDCGEVCGVDSNGASQWCGSEVGSVLDEADGVGAVSSGDVCCVHSSSGSGRGGNETGCVTGDNDDVSENNSVEICGDDVSSSSSGEGSWKAGDVIVDADAGVVDNLGVGDDSDSNETWKGSKGNFCSGGGISDVCGGDFDVSGCENKSTTDHRDNDIDGKNDGWLFYFSSTPIKLFIICNIFQTNLALPIPKRCKWSLHCVKSVQIRSFF